MYGVDVDSLESVKLTSASVSDPSWSPTGGAMTFASTGDIYSVTFDGTAFDTLSVQRLTFDGSNFDPAWSPDGRSIAYERVGCPAAGPMIDSTSCGILRMDPDGKDKLPLIVGRWPTWFPDSRHIVFVGLYEDLYALDTDDSSVERLTHFNSATSLSKHISHPFVSPSGTTIAFAFQPGNGPMNIWAVDATGKNSRAITTEGVLNRFYWSPDSMKILFVRYQSTDWTVENGSLWTVDVVSGVRRHIVSGNLQ